MRRLYTVKLPTDGLTNVDIPVEGPFAGTVGQASAPTAVGADGFFAEWRNRSLLCPNKFSLGAGQFVPRFRLGFSLSAEVVAQAPAAESLTQRVVATGTTIVGNGAAVPVGPFTPSSATAQLAVYLRIADATVTFDYGPGPAQAALGAAGATAFISASLQNNGALNQIILRLANNDGVGHTVQWTIVEIDPGFGAVGRPLPVILCSRSLVGSVLTSAAGATTNGDDALADPANRPSIRVLNGLDVAGQLLRVYLDVAEAAADLYGG